MQFSGLLIIWLSPTLFIATLTWFEFYRMRYNLNVFSLLLFLLMFFFGSPLISILVFRSDVVAAPLEILLQTLLSTACSYAAYYVTYETRLRKRIDNKPRRPLFIINRVEAHLAWTILITIVLVSMNIFFMHDGSLLFRLQSYNQVFSSGVSSVALKHFFYFFIPATLAVYFLRQDSKAWMFLLVNTITSGLLTCVTVGETRANTIIVFTVFSSIGVIRGRILLWTLAAAGVLGIIGTFRLTLKRYGISVSDGETFHTFLYLTRDTFLPQKDPALLLQNYHSIEFQGLAPTARDFYVSIPSRLWPRQPSIVLNSVNYFTQEVLNNHSGLAISPTLIGSLVVMGGTLFTPLGATIVRLIIRWSDQLYELGNREINRYRAAILRSFRSGTIFNMTALTREGLGLFVSRVVFFPVIFGVYLLMTELLFWLFDSTGLVHERIKLLPRTQTERS